MSTILKTTQYPTTTSATTEYLFITSTTTEYPSATLTAKEYPSETPRTTEYQFAAFQAIQKSSLMSTSIESLSINPKAT